MHVWLHTFTHSYRSYVCWTFYYVCRFDYTFTFWFTFVPFCWFSFIRCLILRLRTGLRVYTAHVYLYRLRFHFRYQFICYVWFTGLHVPDARLPRYVLVCSGLLPFAHRYYRCVTFTTFVDLVTDSTFAAVSVTFGTFSSVVGLLLYVTFAVRYVLRLVLPALR